MTTEVAPAGGSDGERFREAIKAGDMGLVTELVDKVDLDSPDKPGNTSLHSAALFNQTEMIKLFLQRGASLSAKNNIGETPVDIASVDHAYVAQKMASYGETGTW